MARCFSPRWLRNVECWEKLLERLASEGGEGVKKGFVPGLSNRAFLRLYAERLLFI